MTNALNPPQFHPDGRTLAYVDGQSLHEVWVLEELLAELDESR